MESLLDTVQRVTPIKTKEGTSASSNSENTTEINQTNQTVLNDSQDTLMLAMVTN